ncbi:MAG TPA: hypothetical protein VF659_18280 [Pyrinomonadaceae bacterium]|jgi:hypothetical protein
MRGDIQAPDSGKNHLQEVKGTGEAPPENRSHTLRNVIRSGRAVVVAPLITGGYQASTLIATGQYVGALKCAAAAGGALLVLTIFLELADAFVEFMRKRQVAKARDKGS